MEKTTLPLAAVEAMCKDLKGLINTPENGRRYYMMGYTCLKTCPAPDWAIAAANCTDEKDVLPVAMQVYLSDWEAEK